jgi:hypothetical protein
MKRSIPLAFIFIAFLTPVLCAQTEMARVPIAKWAKITFATALGDSVVLNNTNETNVNGRIERSSRSWLITPDGNKREIGFPNESEGLAVAATSAPNGILYYVIKKAGKGITVKGSVFDFAYGKIQPYPKSIALPGDAISFYFHKDLHFVYLDKAAGQIKLLRIHDFEITREWKFKVPKKVFNFDRKAIAVCHDHLPLTPLQASKPMKIHIANEEMFVCIDEQPYYNMQGDFVPGKSTILRSTEQEVIGNLFKGATDGENASCLRGSFSKHDTIFTSEICKGSVKISMYKWDSLLNSAVITESALESDSTLVGRQHRGSAKWMMGPSFKVVAPAFVTVQSADSGQYLVKTGIHFEMPGTILSPFSGFGLLGLATTIGSAIVASATDHPSIDNYFYLEGNAKQPFKNPTAKVPQDLIDGYVAKIKDHERTNVSGANFEYLISREKRTEELTVMKFPRK